MANIQSLKRRIRSIKTTAKITNAMQLIAHSKYKRCKENVEKTNEYTQTLQRCVKEIVSQNRGITHPYCTEKNSMNHVTILFSSDMGLCAGYNNNMVKLLDSSSENHEVIVIGTVLYPMVIREYRCFEPMVQSDKIQRSQIKKIAQSLLNRFSNNEIGRCDVIYTEHYNSMNIQAKKITLLPVVLEEAEGSDVDMIFEPDAYSVLEECIERMVVDTLMHLLMSSKTSEMAARAVAMENATDNANELNDELLLEYNKTRQAMITQEIAEIVGASK